MSRGTAKSTMKIGRRRRARMAASADSLVISGRVRGAGDDDIGLGQFLVELPEPDRVGLEFRRQLLGSSQGTIGDDQAFDARTHEMACGQGVHVAGAHHEGGVGAQVRIHAPRQTDGRGGDRHRILTDASLRSHAFGRGKGGLEQFIERGAGTAGFLRHAVRILQLTQNLRLAEHHGIESRGDVEGVLDGLLFPVNVQAGSEVQSIAVMPFEPIRQVRAARGAGPVHFGAVASGQDHDLRDPSFLPQRAQGGEQSLLAERDLFAQRDRCGLVIEAEDTEWH
jgi:hypothetical protein